MFSFTNNFYNNNNIADWKSFASQLEKNIPFGKKKVNKIVFCFILQVSLKHSKG
jgi:hypothetical protein